MPKLNECAELVRQLWRGQEIMFNGEHYQLQGYTSSPAPIAEPNLLIAGKSDAILRAVARHGAASNFAFASIQELSTLIPRLAASLEDQGQSLEDTEVTTLDRVFIAMSDDTAEEAWTSAGAPVVNGHPGLVWWPRQTYRDY